MDPKHTQSEGLKWVRTLWGLEPRWTADPVEAVITNVAKATLGLGGHLGTEFLAQGAFNKLYVVTTSARSGKEEGAEFVVRVSLPIDPKWKTESEVATLKWVRENTSLPVPQVLAHNSNRANPVGFEWIMMERVPGRPWADVWKDVEFFAKQDIVRRIALFCSDTFRLQMQSIGSLFENGVRSELTESSSRPDQEPASPSGTGTDTVTDPSRELPVMTYSLGRTVSSVFANGSRGHDGVSRGPFSSSREWIIARLDLAEADCQKRLKLTQEPAEEDSDDDDEGEDPEDLENALLILARLRANFDDVFPPAPEGPISEPSMIVHDDLNKRNILIDDAGSLAAVIDWECITALPLCLACRYPSFLLSKPLDVEPIESKYQHDENGDVAELYWEHLEDYELTQLRKVFMDEMRKLAPGWFEVYESSLRQRDFDFAISASDDPFMIRRLLSWLNDIESGAVDVKGLEERIDNATL